MKNTNLIAMFFLSVALAAGMAGCKSKPYLTPIPGNGAPSGQPDTTTSTTPTRDPRIGEAVPFQPSVTATNIPFGEGGPFANTIANGTPDREKFKEETVYFDFDSATIKPGEEAKLQKVADYFKANTTLEALIIEGNCDERGTEKYNLSLGERRALALREYLVNLGVKAERLKTVTYGAARPAEPGHNEEAWKKNRRGEFVLMLPPK